MSATEVTEPHRSPDGTSSPLRVIYTLAIPVMLEQLGQIFLGTVDTYFAGQIGDQAISAIGVTNMFMTLFAGVFNALGLGIVVMISHALGASDEDKANRILRQAIRVGVAVSLGIGLLNLLFGKYFLRAAGAEGEVLRIGQTYYMAVGVPCIFMCLILMLANALKAAQNTKASMKAALMANLANAVMDAVFIHLGMGVWGLGLATTLARVLNVCLLLRLFIRPVTALKLDRTGWVRDVPLIRELVRYSGPIMLTQLIARAAIVFHGSMILRLGDSYYTANSIINQIDHYDCIPGEGFLTAAATMVSSSLGAKKPKDAARYTKLALSQAVIWTMVLTALLTAFAIPLASIFTKTVEIQLLVKQIMTLLLFFKWVSPFGHVMTSAVQGTGDSKYPFYVTLLGNGVRLLVGYLLAYLAGWKLVGIWCGILLDFFLRGVLLSIRFVKKYRELI